MHRAIKAHLTAKQKQISVDGFEPSIKREMGEFVSLYKRRIRTYSFTIYFDSNTNQDNQVETVDFLKKSA